MTGQGGLSHHPAPLAHRLSRWRLAFILATPPLAWLGQLSVGAALVEWPCFPGPERLILPIDGYGWTGAAAIIVLLLATLLTAAATWSAWLALRETRGERAGDHDELAERGNGRTRFLAYWGVIIGIGSVITTLATLVAFLLVPRCLG